MNENEIIKYALKERLLADIDFYNSYPDHRFSHRFNKRINKLLKEHTTYQSERKNSYIPIKRKMKIALIAIILAVLFTGAAYGVYMIWEKYQIKDYSLYSMLYISESQNAPRILEEKYEIGLDLNEYQEIIHTDLEIEFFAEYRSLKNETVITYSQSTYEVGEQTFINTENALVMPCEMTINGYKGIYFETYYGEKCIIWCNESYIFTVSGSCIGRNELISIAETVKIAE